MTGYSGACMMGYFSIQVIRVPIQGALVTLLKADGLLLFLMMFLCISMVRSNIIIVSGMGDDVPILVALATPLKADGLLLFLMIFLYISVVQCSPHFLSKSPFSLFQAEERAKSQRIHYYPLNDDHLNLCDGKTSFKESHASLSVKLSLVHKYSNTCTCIANIYTGFLDQCANSSQTNYPCHLHIKG